MDLKIYEMIIIMDNYFPIKNDLFIISSFKNKVYKRFCKTIISKKTKIFSSPRSCDITVSSELFKTIQISFANTDDETK